MVQIDRSIEMHLPRRSFIFLQGNAKFYSCTQIAIYFSIAKQEILQLYPHNHLLFSAKYKYKTARKRPSIFLNQNTKF